MAALRSRCGHYIFALWFLSGSFFLSIFLSRHSSNGRQANFAALNRGRHLYSAGRPSRWALAHILVECTFSLPLSQTLTFRPVSADVDLSPSVSRRQHTCMSQPAPCAEYTRRHATLHRVATEVTPKYKSAMNLLQHEVYKEIYGIDAFDDIKFSLFYFLGVS